MRIAFVGVKRKYQELAPEYRDMFNQFHLEIPYYYARDGKNVCSITTVDYEDDEGKRFEGGGWLGCCTEDFHKNYSHDSYDVVFHWRAWHEDLYRPEAINVMLSQDHSFGPKWQADASKAFKEGKLYGILCFRTWHARNTAAECPWLPMDRILLDTTFGVDPEIYRPSEDKDPYQMLWSSDPGRGLDGAISLALRLFQKDKRYRLHICYPDYVKIPAQVKHPALVWHGFVPAGQKLFDLFATTGVLPYTSTFPEPSSRVHRQAQAAGSLVLYPPDMGTPSEVIQNLETGIVASPIGYWVNIIEDAVKSGKWKEIGRKAREFAISERWEVQAQRFNQLIERIKG